MDFSDDGSIVGDGGNDDDDYYEGVLNAFILLAVAVNNDDKESVGQTWSIAPAILKHSVPMPVRAAPLIYP